MQNKLPLLFIVLSTFSFQNSWAENQVLETEYVSDYKLKANVSFLDGINPVNDDGTYNVVIEIPAGTNAKWEVSKSDGSIEWEFKNDKPRIVQYLPYPANYGILPRTLLPKELGGDGDPIDVILLGPAVDRGSVVKAKVLGKLNMLDDGEIDDKIVMVSVNSPLGAVNSVAELDKSFPGVTTVIETWFQSYKGPGEIETKGFSGLSETKEIIDHAIKSYQ